MRKKLSWSYLFVVIGVSGCAAGQDQYAWSPFRAERNKTAEPAQPADSANRVVPQTPARYASSGTSAPVAGPPPITGSAPAVAAQRLDGLMSDGIQAIREQRLDAARQSFLEVLRAVPDHAGAHHGLAMVADLNQRWSESEYHYQLALKSRPRDAGLLNDLGYSYLLQGNLHEASRYLHQAVEVSPQHEKAHENLATLALRLGDRPGAEARLRSIYPPDTALAHAARIERELRQSTPEPAGAPITPITPNASSDVRPDATFEEIRRLAARERQAAEDERMQKLRPLPAADSPRPTDWQLPMEPRPPGLMPESAPPARTALQQSGSTPTGTPPLPGATAVRILPGAGPISATNPAGPAQNPQATSPADHATLPPFAAAGSINPPPYSQPPQSGQLLPAGQPGPVRALGLYQTPPSATTVPPGGAAAMHVAGLNAGPGALFPVGVPSQQVSVNASGSLWQPMNSPSPPPQATLSGFSPGPSPGPAFAETPASAAPAGSTIFPAVPSQVSLQPPAGMIPIAPAQSSGGGDPAAATAADYERQLRELEGQYQRTLEQMSRHTGVTRSPGFAPNPVAPPLR